MTSDELRAMGACLRAVRLERGHTLEEVAAATRIRQRFLEAFEAGQADPSLTDLQLRGFLRNYAAFLHLDFDAMFSAYERQVREQKRPALPFLRRGASPDPPKVPIIPITGNSPVQTPPGGIPAVLVPPDPDAGAGLPRWWFRVLGGLGILVFVAGAAWLAFGLAWQDAMQGFDEADAPTPTTVAPLAIEGAITPSPTVSSATTQATDTTDEDATAPPNSPTPANSPSAAGVIMPPANDTNLDMTGATTIAIVVTAQQRSWVRVTVDGVVEYEGLMRPGTALQYQGSQSVSLRTANAGGIDVEVNNQNLGPLGARGELYERTFSLDDLGQPLVTPPPVETVPPTPTIAPIDEDAPPPLLPDTPAPTQAATSPPNLPTPLPVPEG